MKYRVIKRTESDGQTWFYPQYRKWFHWRMFTYEHYVTDLMVNTRKEVRRFKDIESAFMFIDNQPCVDICVDRYKDACNTVGEVAQQVFRLRIYRDTTSDDVDKFFESIGKGYLYHASKETLCATGNSGIVIYMGITCGWRLFELKPNDILLYSAGDLFRVPSWFFDELTILCNKDEVQKEASSN